MLRPKALNPNPAEYVLLKRSDSDPALLKFEIQNTPTFSEYIFFYPFDILT